MNEPEPALAPTRTGAFLKFAATAVGFLVSAYFVSTIIFNIGGPQQTMSEAARWAIGGFALLFTLVMVLAFVLAGRGYRDWRIEGGKLLLMRVKDGPVAAAIEIGSIQKAEAEGGHSEMLAKAEGYEDAMPGEEERGVLLVIAGGKRYKIHTQSHETARELQARLKP